jgi:hypothetical protein
MQFIESTNFGVRSARLSFTSRTTSTRITLFPMVHVGEPAFYEATYRDAFAHDVVLVEGVNSPVVRRVTRSYRWQVGSRAMAGLVVQPLARGEVISGRVVHADLSAGEFAQEWRRVPLWTRAMIYVLAPMVGLCRRYSSRAAIAKNLACDDEPGVGELLAIDPETGGLTQALLSSRDDRLVERLDSELADAKPRSLAIVYGALHMRAVVRAITTRYDYFASGAEWRLVFGLD